MAYLNNPYADEANTLVKAAKAVSAVSAASGNYLNSSGAWGVVGTSTGNITLNTTYTGGFAVTKPSPDKTPEPPQGWSVVKVRGEAAYLDSGSDVYISPVNGKAAHFASLTITNQAAKHHWTLFKKLHPEVDFLNVGMANEEGDGRYMSAVMSHIIFPKAEHAEIFENWLSDYLEMFDGSLENLYSYRLPPPPTTMGYSVQVHMKDHEDLVDFCLWKMEQCNDKVYYLGGMLFFMNDEDAMLYKMKFA